MKRTENRNERTLFDPRIARISLFLFDVMRPRAFDKTRLMYGLALLFAVLGASVFRTPAIIFLVAILISAPPIGFLVGKRGTLQLQARCDGPTTAHVGDLLPLHLEVVNKGRWPLFLVNLRVAPLVPASQILAQNAVRRRQPNLISDKKIFQVLGPMEITFPTLWPQAKADGEILLRLKRRGLFQMEGVSGAIQDPIGLQRGEKWLCPPRTVEVWPRVHHISRCALGGGDGVTSRAHHAVVVAEASDFAGVRPHRMGEEIRRIHWKSTARTGKLHVIEWEDETAADLTLLLDVAALPEEEAAFERAVEAATSLVGYLLDAGRRVELGFWKQEGSEPPQFQMLRATHAHAREKLWRELAFVRSIAPSHTALLSNARAKKRPTAPANAIQPTSDYDVIALARAARRASKLNAPALFLTLQQSDFLSAARVWNANRSPLARAQTLVFYSQNNVPSDAYPTVRHVGFADSIVEALERPF